MAGDLLPGIHEDAATGQDREVARSPSPDDTRTGIPSTISLPRTRLSSIGCYIRSPLWSRRLHSTASLVRAPAPGARTQRRQAARRAQPQARRCGGERSAAFSRSAPGSQAPHIEHRLSEAPPRLRPAARGFWRRAAGPRPRRACSRAARAPQRRRAGGVARAVLAAAPRLGGLAAARPSRRVPCSDGARVALAAAVACGTGGFRWAAYSTSRTTRCID